MWAYVCMNVSVCVCVCVCTHRAQMVEYENGGYKLYRRCESIYLAHTEHSSQNF